MIIKNLEPLELEDLSDFIKDFLVMSKSGEVTFEITLVGNHIIKFSVINENSK